MKLTYKEFLKRVKNCQKDKKINFKYLFDEE